MSAAISPGPMSRACCEFAVLELAQAKWNGVGMKRLKTALGLAIVGAIATPFAFGTWQPQPNAKAWIALTPEHRANLLVSMESSKNCRYFETQVEVRDVLGITPDSKDILDAILCHREQDALRDGGESRAYFSLPRYLAINGALALAAALGIIGVAVAWSYSLRRFRPRTSS
jgi:hypothetical protein